MVTLSSPQGIVGSNPTFRFRNTEPAPQRGTEMPLLNYTTKIEADKTAGHIIGILAGHGAKAVLMEWDDNREVQALSFEVRTPRGIVQIRLPVDPDAVLRVLGKQRVAGHYANREQAVRIAWRILKDWVEAQMAILETEMVKMEQVFLPYIVTGDGRTLYDVMAESKFQLPEGKG